MNNDNLYANEAELTFWVEGGVHPVSISLTNKQIETIIKALGLMPVGNKYGFYSDKSLEEIILPSLPTFEKKQD